MKSAIRLNWDAGQTELLCVVGTANKVSWWIDGIQYGHNEKPQRLASHIECLLGMKHDVSEALRDWLRVSGLPVYPDAPYRKA